MNDSLLLVVLIVLAFVGGRSITRLATRHGMLAGAESLLVGLVIGPVGAGLLDARSLDRAQLLVALLLGLVGFTSGMRARRLAPHPDAVVVGVATSLTVATGMALLALGWMYHFDTDPAAPLIEWRIAGVGDLVLELRASAKQLEAAAVLGASAAACSAGVIEVTARRHGAQGPLHELLAGAAVTGEILAIFLLGFALAGQRQLEGGAAFPLGITEWGLLGMGVGVGCGLLFAWFERDEDDPKRIFVAATGTVIFAAGIGLALGLSPTFINLLAGLTVAFVSPKAPLIGAELERLRHPTHVLVMVFAGMLLVLPTSAGWLLALAYPLARWGLLRAALPLASSLLLERPVRAARMGDGLLGQGALPVVIAVAFVLRVPEYAGLVLPTVLVATVTSDLYAVRALSNVLLDAGEIPDTTAAFAGGSEVVSAADLEGLASEATPPSAPAAAAPPSAPPASIAPAAAAPVEAGGPDLAAASAAPSAAEVQR